MDQPIKDLYLEDFEPGQVLECGSVTVTEEMIVDFANRYDPQTFHTDREAAKEGPYEGLIASGWHTASLTMRRIVDGYVHRVNGLGSPGVDTMRWLLPVRPGDTLSVRVTMNVVRVSKTKPDRGIAHHLTEVTNQRGELVMTMEGMSMMLRRPGRA